MYFSNRCFGATWVALIVLLLMVQQARADVGLITYGGRGVSAYITNAGHSAIFLSNLCPDGPLKLRKCVEGEDGAVIGRYSNWGTGPDGAKVPKDWAVVPPIAHFYGVETRDQIPLFFTREIGAALRERYRARYLSHLIRAPKEGERESPGQWQNMLTVSAVRGADILMLETTEEEDQQRRRSHPTLLSGRSRTSG